MIWMFMLKYYIYTFISLHSICRWRCLLSSHTQRSQLPMTCTFFGTYLAHLRATPNKRAGLIYSWGIRYCVFISTAKRKWHFSASPSISFCSVKHHAAVVDSIAQWLRISLVSAIAPRCVESFRVWPVRGNVKGDLDITPHSYNKGKA